MCPPYLTETSFPILRDAIKKIDVRTSSIIDFLATREENSISKFNLSDVPEFLSGKERNRLWREVLRTAQKGSFILYRSFSPDFFIPVEFADKFIYSESESRKFTNKEMTASYSNVYKYEVRR